MSEFGERQKKGYPLIPISEIEDTLSENERILAIVVNRLVTELRENNFDIGIDLETMSWDEVLVFFSSDWSNRDIKRHAEKLRCHSLLNPFNINEVLDDYVNFVFFDERLRPTNQMALIAVAEKLDQESDFYTTIIPAAMKLGMDIQEAKVRKNKKKKPSFSKGNTLVSAAYDDYERKFDTPPKDSKVLLNWLLGEKGCTGFSEVKKVGDKIIWSEGGYKEASVTKRYFDSAFEKLEPPSDNTL